MIDNIAIPFDVYTPSLTPAASLPEFHSDYSGDSAGARLAGIGRTPFETAIRVALTKLGCFA